ncbi:MAG: hypothetical protein R2882_11715 [Gemmatimonadales bacterium]
MGVRQPVVDRGAAGRILSGLEVLDQLLALPVDPVGRRRGEQVRLAGGRAAGELAERGDVVEDPHRPAVRGDREVAFLDHEVPHRHLREVPPERLPMRPSVEAEPDAAFGAREEQSAPDRILADHPGELLRRNPRRDPVAP